MKNRHYITACIMVLIVSILCLQLTTPVLLSSIRYLGVNQEIEDVRSTYNPGTTAEGRDREVKSLEAKRAQMAQEDPIFSALFSAHSDSTAKKGRDMMVIGNVTLFGLGVVCNIASVVEIVEILKKNRLSKTCKKVENAKTTKKANPFDGFDEFSARCLSELLRLQQEGEAEIAQYEKEMKAL